VDQNVRLRPRDRGRTTRGQLRTASVLLGAVALVALTVWGVSAALGASATGQRITRVSVPAVSSAASSAADLQAVASSATLDASATSADATPPVVASPSAVATPVPAPPSPKTVKPAAKAAPVKATGFVVVIDAGHQGRGNNTLEPIGPGSSTKKPAVASGTSGVATHVHESVVNLAVALRLRSALEARGIRVIMVRTSENVNIANSQRAKIANAAHAGLFIRLHCDGVAGHPGVSGLLTLVPAKNQWTGPIVSASARAGRDIHAATLASTGATDRGITPRSDMSGFNWSQVPSVIVEMGVMTNAAEDRSLSTAGYQQKLADGMAAGIARFATGK
jgi:N-acetylmuramoyl-L-alanine amidase